MTDREIKEIKELVGKLSEIIQDRDDPAEIQVSAVCFLLADLAAFHEAPKIHVVRMFSGLYNKFIDSEVSVCH